MGSRIEGTGAEDGREDVQEQNSALDWMLDSSHVNVGLWNHFGGHRTRPVDGGNHDQEEVQQLSSLDGSLLSPYGEKDPLRRLDGRRSFRAGEQGVGDRGGELQRELDIFRSVGSTDIALDPLNVRSRQHPATIYMAPDVLYPNTSAGSIQDDPPSQTSSSTALSIDEFHEQPAEVSRSIFDESEYTHLGQRHNHLLPRLQMSYKGPLSSDSSCHTPPTYMHEPFNDIPIIIEPQPARGTLHHVAYSTSPDNHRSGHGELSQEDDADAAPSQPYDSPQQQYIWNNALKTDDQTLSLGSLHSESPGISSATRSPEGSFICQRCDPPRRYNRNEHFQNHIAAYNPARKVWVTVDISPDKKFLANCRACQTGEQYGACYDAAVHLTLVHFNPHKGIRGLETTQGLGDFKSPSMMVLRYWMKEVDEHIDLEHRVSHLAGLERAVSGNSGAADDYSSSWDKKEGADQETVGPATDNSYLQLFNKSDPVLAQSPKRQEENRWLTPNWSMTSNRSATSPQSVDSGYSSGVVMQDCKQQIDRERNYWSRPADDGNSCIKDEPVDLDADVKVPSPKDESGKYGDTGLKRESSRTVAEKSIFKEWQEWAGKGERFTTKTDQGIDGYESGHLTSVKPGLNQYQQYYEQRNLKRKLDSYLPSAVPTNSTGHKSDHFPSTAIETSDVNYEENSAKCKFSKTYHAKDTVCTMKAESDSFEASSVTAAPLISFNMEQSHPRHRSTLPIPFGHPKSRQWTSMLPSIKACTREMMGKGNGGALELFLVNGEPTVCITCWDPLKLNMALVRSCMEPLGLAINITQGKIRRSAGGEHDSLAIATVPEQGQCTLPSIHGHYMQRPTCGASLGTADGPVKRGKVSLGGYLKVKHHYRQDWSYYAMTVHHILVSDDQNEPLTSSIGNDEDEPMVEPGYDYSPGVCNGVHDLGDGPGDRVTFSCPAIPDAENLISRLESRRRMRCADESYAAIDNVDNLDDMLNKVCTRENTMFGNAAWSSGLCLDQDVEMDWLLIGDLPVERIGCNKPGDAAAYMEGSHRDPLSNGCWTPSAHVDENAFSTMMNLSAREWGRPGSDGGYLSRVFGRGSETGLADGFLSPHPSIFYDETYGPYDGWAFTPRYEYGLGDSGDSGTWIFTSEGKLLGQIISYNRARHITYFTPICKIFDHIKRITGATHVELLTPEDVKENLPVTRRGASGLPSPDEEPVNPNRYPEPMATDIGRSANSSVLRKRIISPPRTPAASSQPLSVSFSHVLCFTADLPTPSSTQPSDSSD